MARELGMDGRSVDRYARARTWQEVIRPPPRKPSTLDPYLDHLRHALDWPKGARAEDVPRSPRSGRSRVTCRPRATHLPDVLAAAPTAATRCAPTTSSQVIDLRILLESSEGIRSKRKGLANRGILAEAEAEPVLFTRPQSVMRT